MNDDLRTFYRWARASRQGVLDWFESLPDGVLSQRREDFAFGSILAIYAHVADTYLFWIGEVGLGETTPELRIAGVDDLREAFDRVDGTVAKALGAFDRPDEPVSWTSPSTGRVATLTRRWLVAHPVTHEFHHKGQALALARVLGHPHHGKPDTDLAEPGMAAERLD